MELGEALFEIHHDQGEAHDNEVAAPDETFQYDIYRNQNNKKNDDIRSVFVLTIVRAEIGALVYKELEHNQECHQEIEKDVFI